MSEQKQFKISEERLAQFGHEMLMFGQQHRLDPWELAIVLRLIDKWLTDKLGLEVKEVLEQQ